MINKLKLLDLFSGIGGFSLGLESTGGFETIAFVEKDEFCQKVLKKHWSNITIEGDIRNVKGEKYEADVITGGFPCQPFSVAGKRKGKNDDRYLWDETIRVVKECKPRWFVGENVEGLININNGLVLRQVQTDLEKEGFEVQCLVIPASGIGAWHQRKRVWIIAYSEHNGLHRSQGNATKSSSNEQKDRLFIGDDNNVPNSHNTRDRTSKYDFKKRETINKGWERFSQLKFSGYSEDVSNSKSKRTRKDEGRIWEGSRGIDGGQGTNQNVPNSKSIRYRGRESEECQIGEWSFFQREQEGGEVGSEVKGCDRNVSNTNDKGLQRFNSKRILSEQELRFTSNKDDEGRETWWQTQSRLCRIPDGVSTTLDKDRTNRIKALGNSIVPQIIREIGFAILTAEIKNDK